jgi:hypothetical protein
MTETRLARLITFYSYKGGTGRSMALANTAWVLASNGKRVLVIDWDLEAPGLHRYFDPFLSDPDLVKSDGLIEFFIKFASAAIAPDEGSVQDNDQSWFEPYSNLIPYACPIDYPFAKPGCLDIVPAGRQDGNYSVRVNGFNWDRFFTVFGGGIFLESVKRRLRKEYDFILIDSRTGVSDTAGICSIQMPDDLVVCFTLNRQSILGSLAVARSAFDQRMTADGPRLKIWPIPTRIEAAEKLKRDRMHGYAMRVFQDLLPQIQQRELYWGSVSVPYQPFYAYEELLAVFGDPPGIQGSMLSAAEAIASKISDGEISRLAPQSEGTRLDILRRFPGLSADIESAQSAIRAERNVKPAMAERYRCYISHSAIDTVDSLLALFVSDLNRELQLITGQERGQCFFDNSTIPQSGDLAGWMRSTIDRADVYLVLVSPSYLQSEWLRQELDYVQSANKPILSVDWIPADSVDADVNWSKKLISQDVLKQFRFDPLGLKAGIRGSLRHSAAGSEYHDMVALLADHIFKRSLSLSAVQGQKAEDQVLRQLKALAVEYMDLRRRMQGGDGRTRLMQAIVEKMRSAFPAARYLLDRLAKSDSPGERLAAIVCLQAQPDINYIEWLARRVDPGIERPFVGYQAAVALRAAVHILFAVAAEDLEHCLRIALESIANKPDSDRDRTLRRALSELLQLASK